MLPEEVANRILEGHSARLTILDIVPAFKLELQLDYSGLMAKGAYKGWKKSKHTERRKVGCFDFKIFRVANSKLLPMVHPRVIADACQTLERESVEGIFSGKDPLELGLGEDESVVAREVQLAMLEQEINWGDEQFQSWTYFPPSRNKRPRDYIVAYLRRIFAEPSFLSTVERIRAASGTRGVLPPPKPGKEWNPYLEPDTSRLKPWLEGRLLARYQSTAARMSDNPCYEDAYGSEIH